MAHRKIGTIITECKRLGIPTDNIPLEFHNVRVVINNRLRRTFGYAKRKVMYGEIQDQWIEINKRVHADAAQFRDTLAHEVAHIVAGIGEGHGRKWKRIARALGHTGERCATQTAGMRIGIPRPKRRSVRIVARCGRCDFEVIRTRALRRGSRYTHVGCGGKIEAVD